MQAARIDHDAILLDESSDTRDLRHPFGFGEPEADRPVLQGAQLGKRLLRAADHILIDPADTCRVRSDAGRNTRGQASRGRTQIFKHPRTRPIEIGAILEDHIDEGDAEKGEAAHDARLRHGEHGGGQRISDLVLNNLRRLARILGIDDDLHVGEVGDCVERDARDGIDTGDRHEDRRQSDQKDVARRPADEGGDHFWISG